MKRFLLLVPFSLFLVLTAYFVVGLKRDPSSIPSVLIDRPLPAFDLAPIKGQTEGFAASDLEGKVTLVNIFASWCVSCIIEHPVLMEIAASDSVLLTGIDWKDKPGEGMRWLNRNGNPYALIGDDADGRTAIDFGVTGAPETFVVDKTGRIRYKQVGPITPRVWREQLKPLIDKLEQEGSGPGA